MAHKSTVGIKRKFKSVLYNDLVFQTINLSPSLTLLDVFYTFLKAACYSVYLMKIIIVPTVDASHPQWVCSTHSGWAPPTMDEPRLQWMSYIYNEWAHLQWINPAHNGWAPPTMEEFHLEWKSPNHNGWDPPIMDELRLQWVSPPTMN
jgi:hypothetical protein